VTPDISEKNRILLRQIKPYDVIVYLKNKGWSEENTDSSDVLRFISPRPVRSTGPHINILIPKSKKLIGSRDLLEFSLKSLSSFEKRSAFDIIRDMLNFADCFNARILEAKKGLLQLDLGILLYKGSFNLIKFSAISEYNSLHRKHTKKPELAMQCARSCLMGPGGYGSYIAHIYVPLKRPSSNFPWDNTSPFQRKVVLRILRGLASIRDSESEQSSDPIITNYNNGLNLNMCNAIRDIIEAGRGNKVIIDAVLEPTYKTPSDISTKFTLSQKNIYYLDNAIKIFREDAQKSTVERQISGVPTILSRPESIERGTIRVKWYYVDIDKTITVSVDLDKNEYQDATNAHRDKMNVVVTGDLELVGKQWYLSNPRGFRVIPEEPRPEASFDRFLE